jgi:hypothetical protein
VPPRTPLSRGCCYLRMLPTVNRLAFLFRSKFPAGLMLISGKTSPFCQLFDNTQYGIWRSGCLRRVFWVSERSSELYLFLSVSFARNISAFHPRITRSIGNKSLYIGIDIAPASLVKAIRPLNSPLYDMRREAFAMGKRSIH